MNKTALSTAIIAALFYYPSSSFAGNGNGNTPNLNQLDCTQDQIPQFDEVNDNWVCATLPSGGSDSGLELVDGDGVVLGDVLLVESSTSIWANLNVVGKTTPAHVTATVGVKCVIKKACKKSTGGVSDCILPVALNGNGYCTSIGGNVTDAGSVYYEGESCSGLSYATPLALDAGLLSYLESDTVYLMLNQARDMWTEVVVDTYATPVTKQVMSYRTRTDNCIDYSLPIVRANLVPASIDEATEEAVPTTPLSVEPEP